MSELLRRLLRLFRRERFDRDLEEEMRFHLEMRAGENRENGMGPEEARYAAKRQFGNLTMLKEAGRDVWGWPPVERFGQDMKHAFRVLRKSPGFTAVAVLTLALGIGANTAVFSVVNAVLLRPLPFRDPDRLVMIWEKWRNGLDQGAVSPGNFVDWKEQSRSFERMAAIWNGSSQIDIAGEPVEVRPARVTADFFAALGVQPALGRTFLLEEERTSGHRVAILGHSLWLRLGADRKLVGGTVQFGREPYTVVGVAPAGFAFPSGTEVWFPLPPDQLRPQMRGSHYLRVIGKLRSGVGLAESQSEMDTIAARLRRMYPRYNARIGVNLVPLHQQIVGDVRPVLLILLGAVACVLLIACANVANLLLARAAGRSREIALRVALGASRWRVVRALLAESILLSSLGGALGLAGAYWGVRAFVALDPIKLPRVEEIAVDRTVLLFTVVAAVATGILFGLAPALRVSNPDLNEALKEDSGRQVTGSLRRSRGRSALAVAQMALAIVLLSGAGLLLRSFVLRVTVPLGFRPDGVLSVELPSAAHRGIDTLLERLRALPGIESAGASSTPPHWPPGMTSDFEIEARPKIPEEHYEAGMILVTPDYFRVAGMVLRKGRFPAASDAADAPRIALINETMARRYFPGEDPIGRRLRWAGRDPWWRIVGVVRDTKGFGVDGPLMPTLYLPHGQGQWGNEVHILLRTAVPPATLAGAARKEIRSWSKQLVIGDIVPMRDLLSDSVAVPRFYLLLVAAFAALALTLAAIGVYGTVSYAVAQRTHEIGVRMALGAARGDVLSMVLRQGLALTLAGAALGLAGAWAATRVLASLLFRVRPDDAAALAGAAVLLIAVTLAAGYLPARRAARVDPIEALRHE